ncbi:hypothetical protein N0V93_008712 [Gnomoniopsis smithogilvyi]|uniref:Protein tyrosine phosphatase n=1 Tax=Gnomoniopsis smithogilvyi TaxID=1191159 RepID=A0A9W8YQT0_9PEZI|nr:hypothetical protein N0V93_008712 [Gnomoniopsis smithogilvyi]
MDRIRSGFHRKSRKDSPSRPTIVTDPSTIRSRNTTPEPASQPSLQVPSVPMKKTSSPVFRTLRDLSRSHKRARSPAAGADTNSPVSSLSARDSPIDRFTNTPHPLSAVSPNGDGAPERDTQPMKPKMPSFLTLSSHDIDAKFQEIVWLERNRMVSAISNPSPDFRWARVTGDHKKLDRYMNIQPWENNRVRLHVPAGKQDYINASPITLRSVSPACAQQNKETSTDDVAGGGSDRYIAMQGPKHKTTDHVWRMIVEQLDSPGVIVMLTETHEGDMEKCYPYFPRNPNDAPLEVGVKDEFSDGFRASVRCEAIEETEAGDAIELRKMVIRVHKGSKTESGNGTHTEYATPVEGFPVDENGDVKMLSPAKTSSDDQDNSATADDDAGSVTVEVGRTSDDHQQESASNTKAASPKPKSRDEARPASELEFEERIVWHFLYKKWPDFGVPAIEDIDSFFTLMRLSREKNANPNNPRIVHCSAGVGRSGTFIALEHLLREMDAGVLENWDAVQARRPIALAIDSTSGNSDGDAASTEAQNGHAESENVAEVEDGSKMDVEEADLDTADEATNDSRDLIFDTVNQLREQRRHMVQAEPQFEFIYQVMRKLWEDKYGGSKSPSRGVTPVSEHPPRLSLSTDGEPAAKRLEFDPFVGE